MNTPYFLTDASGYVVGAVGYPANGYTKFEGEIPEGFLLDCYILSGTELILDEEKKAIEWPDLEEDPNLPLS